MEKYNLFGNNNITHQILSSSAPIESTNVTDVEVVEMFDNVPGTTDEVTDPNKNFFNDENNNTEYFDDGNNNIDLASVDLPSDKSTDSDSVFASLALLAGQCDLTVVGDGEQEQI
jgi:hypothetical protein